MEHCGYCPERIPHSISLCSTLCGQTTSCLLNTVETSEIVSSIKRHCEEIEPLTWGLDKCHDVYVSYDSDLTNPNHDQWLLILLVNSFLSPMWLNIITHVVVITAKLKSYHSSVETVDQVTRGCNYSVQLTSLAGTMSFSFKFRILDG